MKKLLRKLKNLVFGPELPFPDLGKFLLIGGPLHLQIRETFCRDAIIDTEEHGVYRREFLEFKDDFCIVQVYVHESTSLKEALGLLTRGRHAAEN